MRIKRENDTLLLAFNQTESRLLLRVFQQLIENYRLKPDAIDPRTASVWYSTRGCATARMSAEETSEWIKHLHGLKSGGVQRLENWSRELSATKPGHSQLRLSVEEASALVTAINDYRLMAAARHNIGEAEMDVRSLLQIGGLPPARQQGLLEICFLAAIIEETLQALESSTS